MAGRDIHRCSELPDLESVSLGTEEELNKYKSQALPGWVDTTDPFVRSFLHSFTPVITMHSFICFSLVRSSVRLPSVRLPSVVWQ